mgnify:FL=1|tara:strand:- start:130 stop:471 length:342 start_codon:yes stop_codon:yes gene_type:complete
MEILPITGSKILKIIPRQDATAPVIKLTNKETRTTTTVTPTKTTESGYMVLTSDFTVAKDTLYRYVVEKASDDSTEIYRGLIYGTDQQDKEKYFVNQNEYTEEASFDNEFIIL